MRAGRTESRGAWARALALIILCAASSVLHGADIPRPEHPRPDFQRNRWQSLNGPWQFRFDPEDRGRKDRWFSGSIPFERSITVPFCWESKLSGIENPGKQKVAWYRRSIEIPSSWVGDRVFLRFEAVDWDATVWVNGKEVGRHEGGYTPFAIDITPHLTDGKGTVVVRVFDPTDPSLPTGKQVYWYTTTSGIWQTVWLEARPTSHVQRLHLTPNHANGRWELEVFIEAAGEGSANLRAKSTAWSDAKSLGAIQFKDGKGSLCQTLVIDRAKTWTPESPHLYDLEITLESEKGRDQVTSYFGLRTIARGRFENNPHESILLNDRPLYLRGALDQSFNPEGIYTAPTDEFLRRDIELAKQAGINMLRIHIKPDEPRRLYWADKLGLLIMEDMPNTWNQTAAARRAWENTFKEVVERDRSHPSIISWVLFNETWGLGRGLDYGGEFKRNKDTQAWVARVWKDAKALDPSRLIEDNSPDKRDHVVTDLNSWHFYIDDDSAARRHIDEIVSSTRPGSTFNFVPGATQGNEPLINSEYGSVSAGGGDRDVSWGFRDLTTLLRRQEKIQGYIYTELSDIEWEHNGFYNYDRSAKDFGYDAWVENMTVADLQGADFVGYEGMPAITIAPGEAVEVTPFVSHWSEVVDPPTLRWWIVGSDDLGRAIKTETKSQPVEWALTKVTRQKPIRFVPTDARPWVGAVAMELIDVKGKRRAANFVNVNAAAQSFRGVEFLDSKRVALRVEPMSFAALEWPGADPSKMPKGKFSANGSGKVRYEIAIPPAVLAARPVKATLLLELSARAAREKVDWPSRKNPLDYPQTDGRKHPSEVMVMVGNQVAGNWRLTDDPADARGVLSHLARVHHGSHGELRTVDVPLENVRAWLKDNKISLTLTTPQNARGGGMALYGRTMGRYPIDPTILIETEKPIEGESR